MRTSNKQCRVQVNRRELFKANNLFAEEVGGAYVVYSYGHHFPIYVWKNGQWYGNSEKRSASTTRHQSQARPDGDVVWVPTQQLRNMI